MKSRSNARYPMLPLIRHFQAHTALAWVDHAISAQQFLARATKLASSLPDGRYIINLCEDRYNFLLAFSAALISGKQTLTPSSRAPLALSQIQLEFDTGTIIDDQMVTNHRTLFQAASENSSTEPLTIPEIPEDQIAITLFTSGSTGQPTAHSKTWGMLVQGADQLQQAFKVAPGSCVLGTVPPQHMFGLESTIVFPLQWGCTVHHGRPLLPGDVEQTIVEYQENNAHASIWLATTPVHLRACIQDAISVTGIAGAISATMPLDQNCAQAAEKLLNCPLHEIYGCTEVGIIATRRTAMAQEWQLCPDLQLRIEDGQGLLEGARVVERLTLADHIAMHTPARFSLIGRAGDMVKIAGKRTSLAALNATLLAIDGIDDGCFFRPASPNGDLHDDQRLKAFVVAPHLSTQEIISKLRDRIDSIFVPRPLWKVAKLPRDGNGKITQIELKKLTQQCEQASSDHTDHGTHSVRPDHPALDGHFPGNPIVPGVLLLSEVVQLAAHEHRITGIKQAKFHAPLLPNQAYAIKFNPAAHSCIKFVILHEQLTIASGLLHCEALT